MMALHVPSPAIIAMSQGMWTQLYPITSHIFVFPNLNLDYVICQLGVAWCMPYENMALNSILSIVHIPTYSHLYIAIAATEISIKMIHSMLNVSS